MGAAATTTLKGPEDGLFARRNSLDSISSTGSSRLGRRLSETFGMLARRFSSGGGGSSVRGSRRNVSTAFDPCFCPNLNGLDDNLIVCEYVQRKNGTFQKTRKIGAFISRWWHFPPIKNTPRGLPIAPPNAAYEWCEPWHVSKWIQYSNPYSRRKDKMRYWMRRAARYTDESGRSEGKEEKSRKKKTLQGWAIERT